MQADLLNSCNFKCRFTFDNVKFFVLGYDFERVRVQGGIRINEMGACKRVKLLGEKLHGFPSVGRPAFQVAHNSGTAGRIG